MKRQKVDSTRLGEALGKFGTLQNALEHMLVEKQNTEATIARLKKQNRELAATRDKLNCDIEILDDRLRKRRLEFQDLTAEIAQHRRQYGLFAGFMAMVAGSPSIADSLDVLIASFQRLKMTGWSVTKTPEELRSMFIRIVMGDYLRSYRCQACGAQFITNTNKETRYGFDRYCCPVCHCQYTLSEDDSFLRLMVSDKKQLADIQHTQEIIEENKKLNPLKVFLEVPCEICQKPIGSWDDYNTRLVIRGIGFGHTTCWKSEIGQLRQLEKAIPQITGKKA